MGFSARVQVLVAFSILLFAALFGQAASAAEPPDPDQFTAQGIVLMDAKTGEILYQKNETKPFYPASITKIMTAILALESERLEEEAVVSKQARYVDGNRIYLGEGEKKPLLDLVYGMMLNSGNDAAVAIAEHLGGSVERFAAMMNEKALQLGARQTHFVNPHGLPDEEHVTTPLDMAHIARYALQNDLFREIVSTKTMPWQGEEWQSTLINTNEMLWRYEGMTGIKTGYTRAAGQTYVGSAQKGETELIVVLLKAESRPRLWMEAAALLDYGFDRFETVKVLQKGQLIRHKKDGQDDIFQVEEDVYLTLEKGKDFEVQWEGQVEWPGGPFSPLKDVWTSDYVIVKNGEEVARVPVSYQFSRPVHGPGTVQVQKNEGAKPAVNILSHPQSKVMDAVTEQSSGGWGLKIILPLFLLAVFSLFLLLRWRKKRGEMLPWPDRGTTISPSRYVYLPKRRSSNPFSSKHWPPS